MNSFNLLIPAPRLRHFWKHVETSEHNQRLQIQSYSLFYKDHTWDSRAKWPALRKHFSKSGPQLSSINTIQKCIRNANSLAIFQIHQIRISGVGPSTLGFNKPCRGFFCKLWLENRYRISQSEVITKHIFWLDQDLGLNPGHFLALWLWASYLISQPQIPSLEREESSNYWWFPPRVPTFLNDGNKEGTLRASLMWWLSPAGRRSDCHFLSQGSGVFF